MLASFIPRTIKGGLDSLEFSRVFNKLEGKLLYPKEEEQSRKILRFSTPKQIELEKMAIVLQDLLGEPFILLVNSVYKLKALKVQLINRNNRTGEGPRGRPD